MESFLIIFGILWVYFMAFFVIAQFKKNNSIVDIAWGLGFVVIAWVTYGLYSSHDLRSSIVTLVVTLWGSRLAFHIGKRNWGKPEDYRYVAFRKQWGTRFVLLKAYLHVFLLQNILMYFIAFSLIYINVYSNTPLTYLDYLAILLWCIGFMFESLGDYQLEVFKKNQKNRGKIITTGLWSWTRHPNYFGEALMWWAISLIAVNVPGGIFTIFSGLLIHLLLYFVSGVPLLEKKYEGRVDFEKYKQQTSKFIPMPPKKIV